MEEIENVMFINKIKHINIGTKEKPFWMPEPDENFKKWLSDNHNKKNGRM